MAKKRRSSQFKESSQVIDIEEARRKRQEKRKKQQDREKQAEAATQKRRAARSRVKAGRRKKSIVYAVIIIAIIAAIGMSALNIITLKADYKEAKAENDRLTEQKKELEQQIKDSGKNEYVEKEARDKLRMVIPGETVYIVPYAEETTKATEENGKEEN